MWSMGGQYAAFLINFVASVLIARLFLAPAEVGLFSLAFSAAMLLSVLQDFGLTRYIVGERELGPEQLRTCFSVSVLFALAVAAAIFAIAWPAAHFYEDMRLLPLLIVIAGSYLLVPFAIVPTALIQRRMDFRSMFFITVGAALANAAVSLLLARAGYSAMSLAWGAVAQQAARALLSMWRGAWIPTFPLRLDGARPILRFGSGASVLAVSGAVGGRAPELVIGRLLSFTAVGLYGRAVGLASQLRQLLTGAVAGVFYPAFARIRDNGEDLAPPYLRVVSGYSAVTWPAMCFLAAAALPLVLMLYGPVWKDVAPLLVWIALSEIIFTALPLHMELPILLNRMRTLLKLNLLETAASIGLLLLAAVWSLEWAAASRIAYGVTWFAIYAALMRGLIGFRWRDMLAIYAKSAAASLATVAPLLLVYLLWRAPDQVDFFVLAAAAAAGCLCWVATLFIVRHPVRHEVIDVLATARAALTQPRFGRS
jgi:O-antigen/teichoic acid export membrane protein